MVRIICEHAERIQYVRNYKVRLAINRNTKPIYILPDEVVNDKNPSCKSTARSLVSLRRHT